MRVHSISVIVVHHDRPELLGDALRSIHNQTLKPAEIIIVDDSSSPENLRRLEQYSTVATILSTSESLGPASARNFGAQKATGEWLAFLDDDDIYLTDRLPHQVRYLEAHPDCDVVGGGLTMRTPDGREEYWGFKGTRVLSCM